MLSKRDKASLDIFWLKDESLEDSENLAPPEASGRGDRGEPGERSGAVQGDL
jgi:hypothetical protein